jgi:FkbM family methyltransferase
LEKNVELNQYSDIIEAKQVAIFDKTGTSRLYLGKTDNLNTLIDSNEYVESEYIEVETIAIDEFLKDKPEVDLIRMDIEGAERQVIDKLIDTLGNGNRKPPKILFETHPTGDIDPDPKFAPLVEKIINFGYRPKIIISSSNEKSMKIFADLGYTPKKIVKAGKFYHGLFENISAEDLIKVAFRRPKVTRAILLVHQQL